MSEDSVLRSVCQVLARGKNPVVFVYGGHKFRTARGSNRVLVSTDSMNMKWLHLVDGDQPDPELLKDVLDQFLVRHVLES